MVVQASAIIGTYDNFIYFWGIHRTVRTIHTQQVPYAITCSKTTIITVITEFGFWSSCSSGLRPSHCNQAQKVCRGIHHLQNSYRHRSSIIREGAACSHMSDHQTNVLVITSIDSTKIQKIKQSSSYEQTIIPKVTTQDSWLSPFDRIRMSILPNHCETLSATMS